MIAAERSPKAEFLALAFLVLVLALHSIFISSRFAPAISTSDANGYWAQGSLLFTTGHSWFEPESSVQYIGYHWLVGESGRYYSRYPPGLPVLIGSVFSVFGHEASVLLNPILAMLSLLGLYLLLRELVGPWWGIVGVSLLATNPVFNQQAVQCYAHMAVTFCLCWGLLFLVRWSRRGRLWEIFLAGLLFGAIPTIRYPEGLFLLGVAMFVLWHLGRQERGWLHLLVAVLAVALPLIPLLIRNQVAFGAFYRTAYALTLEQTGFGWIHFKSHVVEYVGALHGGGVGLVFPIGLLGLTMMCCTPRWRRVGVLLTVLAVPPTLIYMAYYWSHLPRGEAPLRFMLPTFVCYLCGGVWLLARLTSQSSRALKASVVVVFLLVQFTWSLSADDRMEAARVHHEKQLLTQITDALEENIEHRDVVIADRRIAQHLDFVRRWRLVDAELIKPGKILGRPPERSSASDAPSPRQAQKDAAGAAAYSGLDAEERELLVAKDVRRWAGERRVYFVGRGHELRRMRGAHFNESTFKIVSRIATPRSPLSRERTGAAGDEGGFVIAEWILRAQKEE